MDLLVLVVQDRGLDGTVEELVGVPAEELVERVLAGDVDREPASAPARPSPHLAQRGDGSRERHADRRVERADVDPELERVGRDDGEQLALGQAPLELAPLLRGVARAVRRDAIGELAMPGPDQLVGGELRDELDALARLHEADGPRAFAHEPREQLGRFGEDAAARLEDLVLERRVPHRDLPARAGRGVLVDELHVVEAGQPLGELDRVGDRRAREQDPRRRAVGARDAPQPAQHVRDVAAEDAAVHVRLVDDDDREVGEEIAPARVVGQHADVQHVRVREDQVRAAADLRALLARRVAVVDRRPQLLVQPEAVQRARLVLRERLRRIEVERAGVRVGEQRLERRELEAERLAGGGPGRDDRGAGPRALERLRLMGVEALDARRRERALELGMQVARELGERRFAGALERLAHEAPVRAPGVEEAGPRLGLAGDGHPVRC